jgi:hypothetical protein
LAKSPNLAGNYGEKARTWPVALGAKSPHSGGKRDGPDPFLIEVKSAKKMNGRGKKQKRSLEKLRTFYETDESDGLRGFPKLQRRSNKTPETSHIDVINECIREAINEGHAIRQPEHGVYYLVLTEDGPNLEEVLNTLGPKNAVWSFFLNEHKADRTWAPLFSVHSFH